MAGSKRERELARARAARQAQRRAEQRRKQRQRWLTIGTFVGVVALITLIVVLVPSGKKKTPTASPTPSATPSAPATACNAQKPTQQPAQSFKKEPPLTIDKSKSYTMTLKTSCGTIAVALDAAKAPHTVNTLKFLADKGYYDGSFCHRMTASATLTVLQCGDPTGTGSGGPGFTIGEENLAGAKYLRGIMAMAKTSAPHSTSSQFFLIDKDSQLPPQYTVVGHVISGLSVLDAIEAIGQDNANGSGDGAPLKRVYLEKVTVTQS